MTHDELLEAIDYIPLAGFGSWVQPALRAVAELATRETVSRTQHGEEFFEGFHFAMKCVCEVIEEHI